MSPLHVSTSKNKAEVRQDVICSIQCYIWCGGGAGGGWSWHLHHDDHCTNVAGLLYMYRTRVQVGCLYRCPVHCQWSRTQSRGHLGRGNTGTCPHQWSPVGMAPSSVSLDTVCSILQGRLCEPTRGPVSVLRSARQRKVKSEYKLKHML